MIQLESLFLMSRITKARVNTQNINNSGHDVIFFIDCKHVISTRIVQSKCWEIVWFYTVNLLITFNFYISGYRIHNLIKKVYSQDCVPAMLQPAASADHQYPATPNASFLNCKNRGGLIQASYGLRKVSATAEKAFKLNVINTNKINKFDWTSGNIRRVA